MVVEHVWKILIVIPTYAIQVEFVMTEKLLVSHARAQTHV
jgi:hypothetical protein